MRKLLGAILLIYALAGCTQGWGKIYTPLWKFSDFAWTEDGKELFFIFENSEGTQLYRWSANLGYRKVPHFDAFPRIYNVDVYNGLLLASGQEIYIVDADEKAAGPAKLVDAPCCYVGAKFIDRENLLAWVGNPDDKSKDYRGLLTMDTDGKVQTKIAEGSGLIGLSGDRRLALYPSYAGADRSVKHQIYYNVVIRDLVTSEDKLIPNANLGEPWAILGILDDKHLFIRKQGENGESSGLVLRDLETGSESNVPHEDSISRIRLMADGKRIGLLLANQDSGNPWSLASMDLDGSNFKVHVNIRGFPPGRYP